MDERLARDFPDYAEIANPRPLALAEAQALLADDEAVIAYAVADDRTFLLVTRADRAAMHEVEIGADDLREAVNRLRGGLGAGAGVAHSATVTNRRWLVVQASVLATCCSCILGVEGG